LYTWNGERFEFVTDFMGGGEMGYLEQPAVSEAGADRGPRAGSPRGVVDATGSRRPARYNQPDPDEYVRIRGDQLKEKDGRRCGRIRPGRAGCTGRDVLIRSNT